MKRARRNAILFTTICLLSSVVLWKWITAEEPIATIMRLENAVSSLENAYLCMAADMADLQEERNQDPDPEQWTQDNLDAAAGYHYTGYQRCIDARVQVDAQMERWEQGKTVYTNAAQEATEAAYNIGGNGCENNLEPVRVAYPGAPAAMVEDLVAWEWLGDAGLWLQEP